MRRTILRQLLSTTRVRMASSTSTTTTANPPPPTSSNSTSNSKLIYAPSGNNSAPHQADQYTLATLSRSALLPDPLAQFHAWFAAAQAHPVPLPESVCLSTAALPSGRVSSRFVYLKELDARGFVVYSHWGASEDAGLDGTGTGPTGTTMSRKGADVATNPHASLAFWWREMERQVRVEGAVERLSPEESQAYFDLRARGSRIGAWASRQSAVLPPDPETSAATATLAGAGAQEPDGPTVPPTEDGDGDGDKDEENDGRFLLDRRVRATEARFAGVDRIPCPPFWGGLRVVPDTIEFWQGRDSRLHDRFQYTRVGDGEAGGVAGGEKGGWRIDRLSP